MYSVSSVGNFITMCRVKVAPEWDSADCFDYHRRLLCGSWSYSKVSKKGDYYLFMPGRKQADAAYTEIVFPVENETRRMIEEKVFAAYKVFINEPINRPV